MLAGVSVDYYTRLERGNLSGVSESVLEALARALQLDEAERAHLFDLARAAQPTTATPAAGRRSSGSGPSVQRILDAMTGAPRVRTQRPLGHPCRQPARVRPLLELYAAPAGRSNTPRFVFLDPRAQRLLRRLGPRRRRHRRDPAIRSRP